jgi:hypothetical protein
MTRHRRSHLILALALALALAFAALPAHPAAAMDCMVNTNADILVAGTLRLALLDTSCTTITFQAGLPSPIVLTGPLPTIDRDLTLTGPGVGGLTVQGNNTFPLLTINAPGKTVTFGGLTLTGGKAVGAYGGDLRVYAGTVALADLALTDGTAEASRGGAGAYIGGGAVTLTRVTISGNTAPGDAAYQAGAGLHIDEYYGPADVQINDSTIVGNTATDNGGRGLAVVRDSGVAGRTLAVALTNTTVGTPALPNTAVKGFGGGIYAEGATLTLTTSTVSGITAAWGSGLYIKGGAVTLTGSTVRDNIGGGGVADGGGFFLRTGTLTLTSSIVSGNKANFGGGLHINGGTATLTNTTISGNTSDGGSGIESESATTILNFVTFTGNTGDAGGLLAGSGTVTVSNSIVAGNTNKAGQPYDCNGTIASQGHNLWGDQTACPNNAAQGDHNLVALSLPLAAVLTPTLADNGGPTKTHALVTGSPALNAGDDGPACTGTGTGQAGGKDQRGAARPQGGGCDVGAYEAAGFILTTSVQGPGSVSPATGGYQPGVVVTLVPTPANPQSVFTGWIVDGTFQGWASSLSITMNANHSVIATFAAAVPFSDVGVFQPFTQPIVELAARGYIHGYGDGTFGPDDQTLRAQMAALIARAMGYGDSPQNPFTDKCDPANPTNCVDDELWNRVAELAGRNIARGYTDPATCGGSGHVPCYAPRDFVLHAQVLSFITRAMVDAHYWEQQPADPSLYGGVLTGTGHEADVATFVHYTQSVGGVPDYPVGGFFPAWNQPATRGWFARALWAALNSYWSVDRVP